MATEKLLSITDGGSYRGTSAPPAPMTPTNTSGRPIVLPHDSTPVFTFLWEEGTAYSEANIDMDVDGSVTPVRFTYEVPAGQVLWVACLRFAAIGSLSNVSQWPGIGSALTNGCRFVAELGTAGAPDVTIVLDAGLPLKDTGHLLALYHNARVEGTVGTTKSVIAEMPFPPVVNDFLIVDEGLFPDGARIVLTVNDDLSGMDQFHLSMIAGLVPQES